MPRKRLLQWFLVGLVAGPPLTILFGFGWEVILLSPLLGGISFAAGAARVYYAVEFFRRIIPQPTIARGTDEPQNYWDMARRVVVDLRFILATSLIAIVAILLYSGGAPAWQAALLLAFGALAMATAVMRSQMRS